MKSKKVPIPFFTDNDVANAVGDFLMESGHSVIRLRDVMLDNSPDPIVAAACREAGMVLITHNIKHFKQIAKEHQISHSEIDALCRIDLGCRQIAAVGRVKDALSVIEAEWERLATEKRGLRIHVGDGIIRLHR